MADLANYYFHFALHIQSVCHFCGYFDYSWFGGNGNIVGIVKSMTNVSLGLWDAGCWQIKTDDKHNYTLIMLKGCVTVILAIDCEC